MFVSAGRGRSLAGASALVLFPTRARKRVVLSRRALPARGTRPAVPALTQAGRFALSQKHLLSSGDENTQRRIRRFTRARPLGACAARVFRGGNAVRRDVAYALRPAPQIGFRQLPSPRRERTQSPAAPAQRSAPRGRLSQPAHTWRAHLAFVREYQLRGLPNLESRAAFPRVGSGDYALGKDRSARAKRRNPHVGAAGGKTGSSRTRSFAL